jgi:uncharacterized protein YjbJ (UPF0337 family)
MSGMTDSGDGFPFSPVRFFYIFLHTITKLQHHSPLFLSGTVVATSLLSRTAVLYRFLQNQSSYPKEDTMKSGNRDKVEGTLHELKGSIKEVAGKLCDNPKMKIEGTVEKIAGKVQEKVGEVKKVLGK